MTGRIERADCGLLFLEEILGQGRQCPYPRNIGGHVGVDFQPGLSGAWPDFDGH